MTIASLNQNPLIAISIGIALWYLTANTVKLELTEIESTVYWTLWKNKDAERKINCDIFIKLVNKERMSYSLRKITKNELEDSIEKLIQIGCISRQEMFFEIKEEFIQKR